MSGFVAERHLTTWHLWPFRRRSATRVSGTGTRGLKPTATFIQSLRDMGRVRSAQGATRRFGLAGGPSFESDPAEFARQLGFQCVRMNVTHRVRELRQLPLTGPHDPRVCMPRGGHAEGRGEIQILLPLAIPNVDAARPLPNNGPRAVGINERHVARFVLAQLLENFFGPVHACGG